ncbi:protein mono-ADP-ribosyltransferase PARP14-like [Siniperca chuatsi]|uniref:protein mono-ADP-ribosyltransferase PARP14-like n=1 Tax=Siniperca chuatsi TaxID=119488 RepID=UPI001CE19C16|nr:protein mono-ADP-ribosyltransferase PARP14-like [Siniperca chuatsi]XP_044039274.1 protein mono-ADP-ribosyltransferase PARP14-like [Siniperca chuatsi]
MDEYQHPLFFETKDLADREKEKIRRYFQKRRDSGGGDCGLIEKAGGNTYKISFKEKEDQERVLQRKFHTISLPCGELRLTVSRTSSPQNPDPSHSQIFTKTNTKGLEKIFRIDIFLLYYLKDSPKASKVLQKQLSSIGCTVEFNFDEEEAVVRGDIEKGPGGAFGSAAEKWNIQVDQVFICLTEKYLCYHVVEPKQVKILLHDRSFVTDDIKVYTKSGYAVVVGEVEAVKERIAILEKSLPTQKELPIVEKQFKLVEEEFSREMRAHCPDVKIHRGNAMIILEGPNKEVQSGATKLDELIKKVKEKKVNLPTVLVTFITSSGAISKYQARFQQSLRNPVSLEVGSDLVLSSLSSDALDEALAAVQRDLSVATVKLQGAAAARPDLDKVKEIMIKAKNEANCQERRVDVSFIPGPSGTAVTKVRLVGYSQNVNKLKEVLHDYQMNQVRTQEVMNLPHPELVDCFDKILALIGMKKTKVTFKTTHFPYPSVLVSGPRCLVQEAQQALNSALACLASDTLVLDGPRAQRYFQAEGKESKELVESSCQVLIREQQGLYSPNVKNKSQSFSSPSSITPRPSITRRHSTVGSTVVNKTSLEIKLGSLVDEQVNVLVVPMHNGKLNSTKIGKCLLNKAGNAIKSKFNLMAASCTLAPGDVLQVDGPPSLGCSKLFFIECFPWDGVRGQSVQALGNGLKKCLDLCVQQRLCSVAFPVIGHGIVLKYPLREAIQVLTENIHQFGLSASSGSLSTIHIVIKPGYPNSEECYHDVHRHLSLNMNQGGQAIFRSLTSDLDDITMTVGGGIKLQLVFGDITNEITDAVVNTTDFTNFQNDGVCKDILTIAGPEVEAELKAAKVKRGEVFVSQSGSFFCEAILHVCGERDAGIIEQLVCRIIEHCEAFGFKSVAIPAICAGTGGLDPGVVAGAILRGVKAATSSTPLYCLTNIRLVLFKINVFLAFKKEAMQMYSTAVINRVSMPQWPHVQQQYQQQPPSTLSADHSILPTSYTSQQSVFLFLGLSRKDVDDAKTKLKNLYQAQCSTQTFKKEEMACLTQDDVEDLKQLVETEGLYMQKDQSGQGSLTVSGLKDGVNQVRQMINVSLHGSLRREVRVREEEDLYTRVAWCILGPNGNWERLPKTSNHNLENNDIAGGIADALGILWSVDPQRLEATREVTGQTAMLKRLVNLPDFPLPLYWDNMAAGEVLKVVALQPSSAEYRTVKEAFKRTVSKTVMKIERLQNVHLRRAYEVQKKHITDRNIQEGGAGEKLLYHGTTQDNCDSIMKTGFNRRFAGQNATAFGHGTYFAVDASYSANPTYSKPAADGSQLMFVARVLTGIYTLGQNNMKVPPPRSDQRPHDRYDSVVDRINNPNMYVVFHDNQAYPDYLITFK